MASMSPSIPLEGPEGSFKAETNAGKDVRQYMGVKAGSDDQSVTPLSDSDTSGGPVIVGIAQYDANDGETVLVRMGGTSMARANGAVSRNDLLECVYDADESKNGSMKKLTALAQNGGMIAAKALEDAADGELFRVQVLCAIRLPIS